MKIYYSPYFNGHSYIDYEKRGNQYDGLLGETLESTEGLLSRLELMCGMSYPEISEDKRIEEYYDVLKESVAEGNRFYESILNDSKEKDRYHVTEELLRWRDTLIMAGWDKKSLLPGKLSVVSNAEQNVDTDGVIVRGSADRWLELYQSHNIKLLSGQVCIDVYCPKILIPALVQSVISEISKEDCYKCENIADIEVKNCEVINFKEQYEAYQWLACKDPEQKQVVVCSDGQRLDNVLRCLSKPTTSGDANVACHHVINDVRSMLDIPTSLIWIDCNGGYMFHYPYDFMSDEEKEKIVVPAENEMIDAVNRHYVHQLNRIDNVVLVSATYDRSQLLTQHPMVASALHGKNATIKVQQGSVSIKEKNAGNEIHFEAQQDYHINKDVEVTHHRMSASTLENLIQFPFNYVIEKELGLYEPFNETDVNTMKGTVAHKVVELMVEDMGKIDVTKINEYLQKALDDPKCIDKSIGKCILRLDENKFELEDLESTLNDSLKALDEIISDNELEIVGSEVAIPDESEDKKSVDVPGFGPSVAYIDMILKKRGTEDYYIFDFKYSRSPRHSEKLEKNKSTQFAFYKELFTKFYKGGGKKLSGYGYYLFPMNTLYVPNTADRGNLNGANVKPVEVSTEEVSDTLKAMKTAFKYRQAQFKEGVIEEGEGMPVDSQFAKIEGIFPIDNEKGIKKSPYSHNHIVLKNQIR